MYFQQQEFFLDRTVILLLMGFILGILRITYTIRAIKELVACNSLASELLGLLNWLAIIMDISIIVYYNLTLNKNNFTFGILLNTKQTKSKSHLENNKDKGDLCHIFSSEATL